MSIDYQGIRWQLDISAKVTIDYQSKVNQQVNVCNNRVADQEYVFPAKRGQGVVLD